MLTQSEILRRLANLKTTSDEELDEVACVLKKKRNVTKSDVYRKVLE